MKIEETIVNGILVKQYITEDSDLSSQDQKDIWLETCNSCEYKKENQCSYCGCLLETLMILKTGKCPLNKW